MKHFLSSRFIVATLFILVTVSVIFVFAANQNQVSKDLRIENKTKALVIESTTQLRNQNDRRIFKVTVRSDYEKPIVSYSFRVVDNTTHKNSISRVERSGVADGWSLSAKESDANFFSVPPTGEIVITLEAVLFEDGTGDGELPNVTRLQEISAGVKMAYQQIVPILRRVSNQDEPSISDEAIRSLTDEINSISEAKVLGNSIAGFKDAKNYISLELREIKNKLNSKPNLKFNFEIAEQLSKTEEILAGLQLSDESSSTQDESCV